ncbi:MAG: 4Fe-4S dicluster domain-containing protein, partial [Leptospiraceae bacterium]|nr:4Fe-4S dicluster domain-containing protein [Leptospiraceae bacterium]
SFIICEEIITSHERICIDCNDCNYFCPVQANPKELLNRNKSSFLAEKCIECGLCSVFCPSHIDFARRIRELKEELRLALT